MYYQRLCRTQGSTCRSETLRSGHACTCRSQTLRSGHAYRLGPCRLSGGLGGLQGRCVVGSMVHIRHASVKVEHVHLVHLELIPAHTHAAQERSASLQCALSALVRSQPHEKRHTNKNTSFVLQAVALYLLTRRDLSRCTYIANSCLGGQEAIAGWRANMACLAASCSPSFTRTTLPRNVAFAHTGSCAHTQMHARGTLIWT